MISTIRFIFLPLLDVHVSRAVKAGVSVGALVMVVFIYVVAVFIIRRRGKQNIYVNPKEVSYVLFRWILGVVDCL